MLIHCYLVRNHSSKATRGRTDEFRRLLGLCGPEKYSIVIHTTWLTLIFRKRLAAAVGLLAVSSAVTMSVLLYYF